MQSNAITETRQDAATIDRTPDTKDQFARDEQRRERLLNSLLKREIKKMRKAQTIFKHWEQYGENVRVWN